MFKDKKYTHKEEMHNTKDPEILVPLFCEFVKPRSVVDVGCGIGAFLHVFEKDLGVLDYLGIDGPWADQNLVNKYIPKEKFMVSDLEKPIALDRKFDLVLCLEVAEHLQESSAAQFVSSLANLGDIIIFSAAVPYQIGDHHCNEQWPEYWQGLFKEHGYQFYDVIRPMIWDNEKLFWWYKQNIFLVLKDSTELANKYMPCHKIQHIVHPGLLKVRSTELDKIVNGRRGITFYLGLLGKYFMNVFNK